MPLLIPVFGALSQALLRGLGGLVSFLFGWAITSFFGRMPTVKSYLLSAIAVLSLAWWYFAISLAYPPMAIGVRAAAGAERYGPLLALVTAPVLALVPFIVASLSFLVIDGWPPKHIGPRQILQGIVLAPVFGVTFMLMMTVGAVNALVLYTRRIDRQHLPIDIFAGRYMPVVLDVRHALDRAGFQVEVTPLPWRLRFASWMLRPFAPDFVRALAPPHPAMIVGACDLLTVVVHPTDVAVSAQKDTATRAHGAIVTNLLFTDAYFTWEKVTQQYENRLYNIWRYYRKSPLARQRSALRAIELFKREDLYSKQAPYEAWAVVYRQLLKIEEALIVAPLRRQYAIDEGEAARGE